MERSQHIRVGSFSTILGVLMLLGTLFILSPHHGHAFERQTIDVDPSVHTLLCELRAKGEYNNAMKACDEDYLSHEPGTIEEMLEEAASHTVCMVHALATAVCCFFARRKPTSGVIRRLVEALDDRRDARYTDHSYEEMLRQRIFQIACGYDDANDCDSLRRDPAFKAACDRLPIGGETWPVSPP